MSGKANQKSIKNYTTKRPISSLSPDIAFETMEKEKRGKKKKENKKGAMETEEKENENEPHNSGSDEESQPSVSSDDECQQELENVDLVKI